MSPQRKEQNTLTQPTQGEMWMVNKQVKSSNWRITKNFKIVTFSSETVLQMFKCCQQQVLKKDLILSKLSQTSGSFVIGTSTLVSYLNLRKLNFSRFDSSVDFLVINLQTKRMQKIIMVSLIVVKTVNINQKFSKFWHICVFTLYNIKMNELKFIYLYKHLHVIIHQIRKLQKNRLSFKTSEYKITEIKRNMVKA